MSREEEGGERTGSTDCYCVSARHLLVYFPSSWNKYGVYYIWGLFIFSVIVSVYGAVLLLYLKSRGGVEESRNRGEERSIVSFYYLFDRWIRYKCCGRKRETRSMTHDTYPYYWGYETSPSFPSSLIPLLSFHSLSLFSLLHSLSLFHFLSIFHGTN